MKQAFIDEAKWKGTDNPQLGDVVCFDCNRDGVTDQVGIVKSVNDDGTIHIIEGNTGNGAGQKSFWECDRPMSAFVTEPLAHLGALPAQGVWDSVCPVSRVATT